MGYFISCYFERRINMLDKELMEILACPKCKGKVEYNDAKDGLVCPACKLEYPVRDDIPVQTPPGYSHTQSDPHLSAAGSPLAKTYGQGILRRNGADHS